MVVIAILFSFMAGLGIHSAVKPHKTEILTGAVTPLPADLRGESKATQVREQIRQDVTKAISDSRTAPVHVNVVSAPIIVENFEPAEPRTYHPYTEPHYGGETGE